MFQCSKNIKLSDEVVFKMGVANFNQTPDNAARNEDYYPSNSSFLVELHFSSIALTIIYKNNYKIASINNN